MKFGQLKSLSLIHISGDDAASFLQGQLTTDVMALNKNWQLSGYCNPKGRLLIILYLFKDNKDQFYALLPTELSDSIVQRLRMYIMRSKVTISQLTESTIYAFSKIEDLFSIKPELKNTIESNKIHSAFNLEDNYVLTNKNDHALLITNNKKINDAQSNFDETWQQLNIQSGIPAITANNSEKFIPQMVNLDLLEGINFKKGCYTGQEIIARMHYLGNLKQRMFVCDIAETLDSYEAGDKIIRKNPESITTAGYILNAIAGHSQCLAVLKIQDSDEHLFLENGISLSKSSKQPYTI